jgi:hypothetical protein
MIDVPASGDACLMNDDYSRQSVDYRSSAAKFRQKALMVLQAEVQAAKVQHEKIDHALLHFQGDPTLFVDRSSRPTSSTLSPMWCVIADIGSGATDFLPIYAEMLVTKISANRRIAVTTRHVDARGNIHCIVRSTFTPDVVECFDGESVRLRQPDFEDMTAMQKEALESLVWRRGIHPIGLARCIIGEPVVEDTRRAFLRPGQSRRCCHYLGIHSQWGQLDYFDRRIWFRKDWHPKIAVSIPACIAAKLRIGERARAGTVISQKMELRRRLCYLTTAIACCHQRTSSV